jgi:AGCS family alanine or glycine:cation symporter
MAVLVGIVIIGGIKSIAKVTEKIVPFMAVLYVVTALIILGINYAEIPTAFGLIFKSAFSQESMYGGFIGVLLTGFQRASFSNEAGVGSAAIAHSAVKTNEPVSEGFVALLEPFIDTVVICTMTALVIIITGRYTGYDLEGAELTSSAFGSAISWFPSLLAVAVFLFAFSTMISWSYYGLKAWTYLFGNSKRIVQAYKLIFLVFIVIGSSSTLGTVIDFSDMMILAMAFPNIIGLYIMSKEVRLDLRTYMNKVKSGAIKRFK